MNAHSATLQNPVKPDDSLAGGIATKALETAMIKASTKMLAESGVASKRIRATIRREATDRPPVDLWLTPEVLQSPRAHTGIQDELEIYRSLGVDKIIRVDHIPHQGDISGVDRSL